ncbi:MAG: 30S ribosomal protein S21 [Candidatus Brocadiia bacterium]
MSPVTIRVEGSIDKALRQFKRKCIDAGIYNELKRVAYYEKPSETRRKAEIKKGKVVRSLQMKKPPRGAKIPLRPNSRPGFGPRPPR